MRRIIAFTLAALAAGCSHLDAPLPGIPTERAAASPEIQPGRATRPTLAQALALMDERNPTLAMLRMSVKAAAGRAEQADRPPNPYVSGGPMFGFGGPAVDLEGGASVSQAIEIGKRGPRVRAARAAHSVSVAAYRSARSDLALEITLLFNEMLHLQETAAARAELASIAEAAEKIARIAENAGAAARAEVLHAAVAAAGARRAARDARSDLETACRLMEAILDLERDAVSGADGRLKAWPPLSKLDVLRQLPGRDNAEIALARARTEAAAEEIEKQKARAIPDVTMGASWAHRNVGGRGMEMAGLSIGLPIPLFDAAGAAVAAARSEAMGAVEAEKAAMASARAQLETAIEDFSKSRERGRVQSSEILPGLQALLEMEIRSKAAGRSSETAVLQRRAALASARLESFIFMKDAQNALARVAHAAGTDMAALFP